MIFNQFDPNKDIVAGRTTRVASGFWPSGEMTLSQQGLADDFWSLTGSGTPSPSYGTSVYDVRHTMYYLNVYPSLDYLNNSDPYFSIAYGHVGGDIGSGSFSTEISSIKTSPAKTIYTQYKNMLLGSSDLDGKFSMKSSSVTINADDIWVIDFSAYKMKDKIDEGLFQISFSGSNGQFTFIDDSRYITQTQAVYQIITGSLTNLPSNATYGGIGLIYPSNGIVILNASVLANILGINGTNGVGSGFPSINGTWPYTPGTNGTEYTYNHKTLFESIKLCNTNMSVRKSEYVPSRHYFVRVMNRDFNYSNNPTYVYDGTDGIHPKGTIFNSDFVNDPKTYITTVGLYNDSNELVAVAKLSRPAIKDFSSELLIKIKLDF
jgi:hypothetical protein